MIFVFFVVIIILVCIVVPESKNDPYEHASPPALTLPA